MTVAAGIDTGSEASLLTGQGKVLGTAHGAGRAGLATQNFSTPVLPLTESFRTGWQSLLTSLAFTTDRVSGTEAATDLRNTPSAPASGENAQEAPVATATLAAGTALLLRQGTEKGSGETEAATKLSRAVASTGILATRPAAKVARADTTATEEKKPSAKTGIEPALESHRADSIDLAKPEVVAAAPETGLFPAATIYSTAAHDANLKAQSVWAEPSVEQQNRFASACLQSQPLRAGQSSNAARPANEAIQERTNGELTLAHEGPVLAIPGRSGSSGPPSNATELPNAQKDVSPAGAMSAEGGNSRERPALSRGTTHRWEPCSNPNQAAVLGQTLALSSVGDSVASQNPIQTRVTSLNLVETPIAGDGSFRTLVPDKNGAQAAVSSEEAIHATVADRKTAETLAPTPNPAQAVAPEQNLTPSLASGQISSQGFIQDRYRTQTATPALEPIQTSISTQNPIQMLVESANQTAQEQRNEALGEVPASSGGEGSDRLPVAARAAFSQSFQPSAMFPAMNKPGTVSGWKTGALSPLRPECGASNVNPLKQGSFLAEGQLPGPAVDVSATAHELEGARGAAAGSPVATSGPDSGESFAALDAGVAAGRPVWIHAGTQRAEAGFQDPALGWVAVRADLSGGGIHAALVPASADAAAALGSHLVGLSAYLAEHHTPIETLTLASPESGWAGLGSDKGAGQDMQQGAGQQTGQETAQSGHAGIESVPSRRQTQLPQGNSEVTAQQGEFSESTQAAGGHISVMA